jgi:hypothetical protein
MRYGISIAIILLGGWTLSGQPASAQQVVQQPVVGTTSVNTSVSVPDRGSTFLGGVSSAQSGRSQYGPLRSGTSMGISRESTSMSTSVYIIDLHEMDEQILRSYRAKSDSSRKLDDVRWDTVRAYASRKEQEVAPAATVSATEKVAKHEELAQKADLAGKASVAKLHWQMAAKYGSKLAEQRLAQVATPVPPSPSHTRSASR